MNYNISLVIVTYKRSKELECCLKSILLQKTKPIEIIIVDNDTQQSAKSIYNKYNNEITIKYISNKINSLTSGRNIGIRNSKGDIIYFLDDDTEIIGNNFFNNIIKEYKQYPDAIGIQGEIIRTKYKFAKFTDFFNKLFFLAHRKKNKSQVLPSLRLVTPFPLTQTIKCQWFTGGNCSYKKEVFEKYHFDENLIKYSFGEDIDFSYNLYKNNYQLYMTPTVKIIHHKIKEKRNYKEITF